MAFVPLLTLGVGLVAIRRATARATAIRRSRFAPLFLARCRQIPVSYLEALAEAESDFRPGLQTQNCCWGLLQVDRGAVLADYNRRHGLALADTALLDPATNIAVACEHLVRIANGYQKNHPRVASIDFAERRWVELLTYGWNAGFSEAAGTGFVIGKLDAFGLAPADITVDAIHAFALQSDKASRQLRKASKVRFAKEVATAALARAEGVA